MAKNPAPEALYHVYLLISHRDKKELRYHFGIVDRHRALVEQAEHYLHLEAGHGASWGHILTCAEDLVECGCKLHRMGEHYFLGAAGENLKATKVILYDTRDSSFEAQLEKFYEAQQEIRELKGIFGEPVASHVHIDAAVMATTFVTDVAQYLFNFYPQGME